ncbi:ribbon-helix-helix domain-containing protein [Aphanothece hegewaldii]|nr:ribbon-helix-helix domain-containing protein [Aphanothece hegewaldii]
MRHSAEPKALHSVTVTPTAWEALREIAADQGVSISGLLEKIGSRKIKITEEN